MCFSYGPSVGCRPGWMGLAIMFGVLQRIDTPTWLWVAFFVYIPSGILLSVMEEIVKAQVRSGK